MGRLFRRNGIWYGDYRTAQNERVKVSLKTADRQVAVARLRDAELGTTSAAPVPAKALAVAIDDMIALKRPVTASTYREKALHLCRLLGAATDVNSLSRAAVSDYCTARLAEEAHRHTVHKELVVLRQALKEARARGEFVGQLDIVPAWKAEYEPRTAWLTPEQFAALLGAVDPNRRPWLMVQAYTGAELSAMRRLGWEHVNLQRRTITIPGTKRSSRYRVDVPMHPELYDCLRKLDRDAPLIAPWPSVHKQLRAACDKAGIKPPITTHDLRRTFGSWMVQAGVDLHHVARLMGNTYNMVSKVYGQTSDASYSAAIQQLPRVKKLRLRKRSSK